ncbi:formylglycine-generating enzyme family protein [Buttiauxella noackiae]|uniref:formylglycine-generating enzyme family protein n=1 Tax=Buttiauxella noackiae TaxID=82992 RepID=UPI0035A5F6CD
MKYKFVFLLSMASVVLYGCDNKSNTENEQQTQALVNKSLANMIPVKGGDFLMGDFGPLVGEKIPFSINSDDKKLHKVILDDFMVSKYKVTNHDFNEYIKLTNQKALPEGVIVRHYKELSGSDVSVSVPWEIAKNYCLWLGTKSGKKIDLPTEAQWEYASRSRGGYFPYATSNGKMEKGINVPTYEEKEQMTGGFGLPYYPIGKYPPNPLGLFDMGLSGAEWTNDWYAADYYAQSSIKNPKGSEKGKKKVLRGYIGGDDQYALTMFRQSASPIPLLKGWVYEKDGISPGYVFRCVVNN